MQKKLFIIDSTAPFFVKNPNKCINWSKIPFDAIEKKGRFKKKIRHQIRVNFSKYIRRVNEIGYNAVSIDDLCHMVSFSFYPQFLKIKISKYQKYYHKLFKYTREHGLKVFVNSDIMFFNPAIHTKTMSKDHGIIELLKDSLEYVFKRYSEVEGVIFRMGEADGVDVKGDFKSQIILKTSKQANFYIKTLLPIFEKHHKYMIFRTWTTGGYKIGDIMWNEKTFKKTFEGIKSAYFIISMKYGEGDFFRYFKLNNMFFQTDHKKIIELQTRREYEGFGEIPSYIGWEYENFYWKLRDRANIIGTYMWCNTGGWSSQCRSLKKNVYKKFVL